MKEYFPILMKCPLFRGIEEQEAEAVLRCLGAAVREYRKGETVCRAGERIQSLGIVLEGSVHIAREDFWGNRNILAQIGIGQIFAETYACLGTEELDVDVTASEKAKLLFLNVGRIMETCSSCCSAHTVLIRNLLHVLAGKNLMLTGKLRHVMQRSTREKLLSYLSEQSELAHSSEFTVPFDRQQLADYLSVDRSAMSGELGRLRREGMLEFNKNRFRLLESCGDFRHTERETEENSRK